MTTPASHARTDTQESTSRSRKAAEMNAIDLLEKDHREVKSLFRKYDKLVQSEAGGEERQALAQQICQELKIHTQIEEEIFYPAAREALPEGDLVDEATVEHASAKDLIAQIEGDGPDAPLYDAKVTVLGEYINHHVQEEEKEMFPKIRRRMDIKEVGARLQARKEELKGSMPSGSAH